MSRGPGRFGALSRALARVDRYRRLNFTVLACLAVNVALVVSLIGAIEVLDRTSRASLQQSYEHDAASRELQQAAAALERLDDGAVAAAGELAELRDALAARADGLPDAFATERDELDHLIAKIGTAIDSEDGVVPATADAGETIRRLEGLAETFIVLADGEVTEVESDLTGWFTWIQLVAVFSSLLFCWIVVTQILPLSWSIERSLLKLQTWRERANRERARRTLTVQVTDGLDIVDSESAAYDVLARALQVAAPDHSAELLLADSSRAHLHVAAEHPENGSAGCPVVSPSSCPAVRRGATQVFEDSDAIRACPHLAKHADPCSAVCAPLTFMGEPMGVLHAVGEVGVVPPRELVEDLTVVAAEAATRIGTLRAFAKAELQASTDVLTGLPNRRATEERLREVLGDPAGGAATLMELDGLAELTAAHGKGAADRAVKAVADALQLGARPDDLIGRWSGAEFVVVLAGSSAADAADIAHRRREDAEAARARADLLGVAVISGVADTRLAETVRELLGAATDSLGFARRARNRRRAVAARSVI
ncbi:MAG: diguanylate cyclase [Actinomycetota bacterium]